MIRISLALLLLATLAGCATTSRTRPPVPEEPPPQPSTESTVRKKPVVAEPKPPEPAIVAPTPPPFVENTQAEFFCVPGGTPERRAPTERPEGVLAFEPGMTRPEKLSGPSPRYTAEALEKHVQGQMLARCILTREGTVRSCRILKPLPYMDEAVLSALCDSRYTPVLSQGQPVDVEYTFNVRLTLP